MCVAKTSSQETPEHTDMKPNCLKCVPGRARTMGHWNRKFEPASKLCLKCRECSKSSVTPKFHHRRSVTPWIWTTKQKQTHWKLRDRHLSLFWKMNISLTLSPLPVSQHQWLWLFSAHSPLSPPPPASESNENILISEHCSTQRISYLHMITSRAPSRELGPLHQKQNLSDLQALQKLANHLLVFRSW